MNEKIMQAAEKVKSNPEILKALTNKQEAVKLLSKETKLPEAECEKIYDIVVEKAKSGVGDKIAEKMGGKFKLPF